VWWWSWPLFFEPVVEALKAGTCGERNFSTIVPIEPRKPLDVGRGLLTRNDAVEDRERERPEDDRGPFHDDVNPSTLARGPLLSEG